MQDLIVVPVIVILFQRVISSFVLNCDNDEVGFRGFIKKNIYNSMEAGDFDDEDGIKDYKHDDKHENK